MLKSKILLPTFCFLLAGGADEAAGVVGLAQGGNHLPLDEVLAAEAASPVQPLIVQSADVFTLTQKEASLGQFTSTNCDKGGMERGRRGRAKGYRKEDGKRMERRGDRKQQSLEKIDHTLKS